MNLNIYIPIIENLEQFHIYVMNNYDNDDEAQNKGSQL